MLCHPIKKWVVFECVFNTITVRVVFGLVNVGENLQFKNKKTTTKLYKQNLIVSYSNNFHGKICLGAVADLEIGVGGILTYENFVKLTTESLDLMVEDLRILGADFSSLVQFLLEIRIKNFRKKISGSILSFVGSILLGNMGKKF